MQRRADEGLEGKAAPATEGRKIFLRETEVATELDVSTKTLARRRRDGEGPPWGRIGRAIIYNRELFYKWVEEQSYAEIEGAGHPRASGKVGVSVSRGGPRLQSPDRFTGNTTKSIRRSKDAGGSSGTDSADARAA